MTKKSTRFGFTPQENRISVLPSTIAGILALVLTIFNGVVLWPAGEIQSGILLIGGTTLIAYQALFYLFIIPIQDFKAFYSWANAGVMGAAIGLLALTITPGLDIYLRVLLIISVITSSIVSERGPSYLMVILATVPTVIAHGRSNSLAEWTLLSSIGIISFIMIETIRQLKNLSRDHIRRLESINSFTRQIGSTLNTNQVLTLLNAAFQNAIEADTYFVGLREGDQMSLELIYDDGEFYNNQKVSLEGTLSGWVFENQKSLFLPDLRKEVDLPGVRLVLVGRHKTSLSWMGVPMRGTGVDGIIVVGSYHPAAFTRADLEVLSNLAQHAALALDNAKQHAQVELQAKLDSLTGVYNHGHFLTMLSSELDQSKYNPRPLSLIMLDVDYFKQYNDRYGHLAGDQMLTSLCVIIRRYIKQTDVVGRWGGEEFIIYLPDTNGDQAQQVAERIRQTMTTLTVTSREGEEIPLPTISQGIAVYPSEADEAIRLIDLADKRLYIAKERGRNQIEPDMAHWQTIKKNPDKA